MEILFENHVGTVAVSIEEILQKIVIGVLSTEGYHQNVEVSFTVVEAAEIQQLNKQYRNMDKVTDVLSFPLLAPEEVPTAFAQEGLVVLGDIVLCYSRAVEQALEYGNSLEREVAFLIAHSMLHLLGYDHQTPSEEPEMFALQELILLKAGYQRG